MAVCLIAGGAGFLGSHLAEALLARGDTVRVVDNFSHGTPANLVASASRWFPATCGRTGWSAGPWTGWTGCSTWPSPGPGVWPGRCNSAAAGAVGTWHLLLAARDAGCRRVVLASGGEVYGRAEPARVHEDTAAGPGHAGGQGRAAGRAGGRVVRPVVRDRAGPAPVLQRVRPAAGPPGPGARTSPASWRPWRPARRPVLYDHELEPADLLYVEDAVRGCLLAADGDRQDGRVYHIARGRPARAEDVVARLNVLLGNRTHARPGRAVLDHPPGGPAGRASGPASNSGSRPTSIWGRGSGGAWNSSGPTPAGRRPSTSGRN